MRLFFAVEIGADAARDVARSVHPLLGQLGGDARLSAEGELHVTLAFLGVVPDERAAAALACAAEVAPAHAPFRLGLGGVGAFPSVEAPRIVWLGVTSGREALDRLALDLQRALVAAGFTLEERAFSPHLTLARLGRHAPREAIARALAAQGSDEVASAEVGAIVLLRSDGRERGSAYPEVARVPLVGRSA